MFGCIHWEKGSLGELKNCEKKAPGMISKTQCWPSESTRPSFLPSRLGPHDSRHSLSFIASNFSIPYTNVVSPFLCIWLKISRRLAVDTNWEEGSQFVNCQAQAKGFSGSLWLSLALSLALSGSLWLSLAFSGSLWLSQALSGSYSVTLTVTWAWR